MDVLVAVDDDDRVLGFTSIGTCFDDDRRPGGLEIWDLWVDREQRSRGIGASLIAAAHELATGERDITVWVLAANLRGLEFYRRTGAQWDNRVRKTTKPDGVVITDVRLRWPRGVVAIGSGRQG